MARIPMTAREQLLRGQELGHELEVIQRGPWPEHGDPHPKFWLRCSCGYESTVKRSRKALNGTMVWHLSRAIAEFPDTVNGGGGASAR